MFKLILKTTAVFLCISLSSTVWANHSWGPYHWARIFNPFELMVINSTTPDWDPYVADAIYAWSSGSGIRILIEDTGGSTSKRVRRQCKAPGGKIRICNLAYGFNGWLGIAGISVDINGHIVKGYTKLNDSYFNEAYYNNAEWKQSVACQELGHDIGLDHQDEDFNNLSLSSCMDYQDPPFESPNLHDFEQLLTVYGHIDSYDTVAGATPDEGSGSCNAPPGKGCNKSGVPDNNREIGWGVSLGRRGHSETFMRIDPDGTRHITHVLWVEDAASTTSR